MHSSRRLVVDIGTNSVLALLADIVDGKLSVVFDYRKTTRLGEGLMATGSLTESAIERTVDAIALFVKASQFETAVILGTEALRMAKNANAFTNALETAVNLKPLIIPGKKEAELSYLGALYNLAIDKEYVTLVDVGGGSTEVVIGHDEVILNSTSIPIGALKLMELAVDASIEYYIGVATTVLGRGIEGFELSSRAAIVATGGTITSVAGINAGLRTYDAAKIHGQTLQSNQLMEIARRFQNAEQTGRESMIPYDKERANLILPGLGIILAVLGIIKKDAMIVSCGGLRFGAALYPQKIWA